MASPLLSGVHPEAAAKLFPIEWRKEYCRKWGSCRTAEPRSSERTGVVDPAKVTRWALQNAALLAGLMLTTEALVADTKNDAENAAL